MFRSNILEHYFRDQHRPIPLTSHFSCGCEDCIYLDNQAFFHLSSSQALRLNGWLSSGLDFQKIDNVCKNEWVKLVYIAVCFISLSLCLFIEMSVCLSVFLILSIDFVIMMIINTKKTIMITIFSALGCHCYFLY